MQRPPAGEFGLAVALLRVTRGWRQVDLARAVGVSPAWICLIERGQRAFSRTTLDRLMAAMEWPPDCVDEALAFIRAVRRRRAGREPQARGGAPSVESFLALAGIGELPRAAGRLVVAELERGAGLVASGSFECPEEARRQAAGLWARLLPYAPAERRALVREAAEFQSWALCELVCEESVRAAADRPERTLELAELAVEIAALVRGGEGSRRRVEGSAWGFLGNARRVSGKLGAAEEAFARSRELWEAGAAAEGPPLDGGRLLALEASLRYDQRRLAEALGLLERALAAEGGGPAAARLLLQKAKILEELDDYAGAVGALRQAAPLVERQSDARLPLVLRHNLARNLCYLGRAAEAETMLGEVRSLAEKLGNRLDLVRLRWVEGLVATGCGRGAEAIQALRQVRAEFVELEIPYDAALVTLELAALLVGEGRTAEVRDLARQSAAIFAAEGVHREARKALTLFRRAAEAETATPALVCRVVAHLEQARRDQSLRFEAIAGG